ncbi:MAG TPA: hypothetical protein VHG71_12475 [Verrucomicrobiae bacterium]|nr:hypothetical protein [Verrucomicrobiae bacterium]
MKTPIPVKIFLVTVVMPLLAGCMEHDMDYDQTSPAAAPAVAGTQAQPENPPAPRIEAVPISPGPSYVWVAGEWEWRGGGHWIWMRGRWIYPPYPGAVWVSGAWVHREHENVWVDGHWQ